MHTWQFRLLVGLDVVGGVGLLARGFWMQDVLDAAFGGFVIGALAVVAYWVWTTTPGALGPHEVEAVFD